MPVDQPVLGTVTNTYIYIYKYNMNIVTKPMPIDNYEQYKRVINQITGRLYIPIPPESVCVCVLFYQDSGLEKIVIQPT